MALLIFECRKPARVPYRINLSGIADPTPEGFVEYHRKDAWCSFWWDELIIFDGEFWWAADGGPQFEEIVIGDMYCYAEVTLTEVTLEVATKILGYDPTDMPTT